MLALINPKWSVEFGTAPAIIGGVQSCYFAGLAIGAGAWGYCADIWGRKFAFNCTLFTAGAFSCMAGGMPNYASLCIFALLMGSGTGGNLPLDGAIFLESSPRTNQHYLMLLSAFGRLDRSLPRWLDGAFWQTSRVMVPLRPLVQRVKTWAGGMCVSRWEASSSSCGFAGFSYLLFTSPRKISSHEG